MVTYITLLNFTEQGIKNVKQTVDRAKALDALIKKHGGTTRSLYWTQGAYDVVATVDAPDEESGLAILLTLGSLGNVRSQTLRAFTAEEMGRIIGKMK
jgi:uncharacterized protein with GYD domain